MVRIIRLTLAAAATLAALLLVAAAPAGAVAVDCPGAIAQVVTCSTTVAEGGNLVHLHGQVVVVTLTPGFDLTLPSPAAARRDRAAAIARPRRVTAKTWRR